jgi:two-component system, chemotaxis family, response regulator Rcp1
MTEDDDQQVQIFCARIKEPGMNEADPSLVQILLVEDNDGDVFLTRKAFQKAKVANHINVARDGEMALNVMRGDEGFGPAQIPDIVLLDINLPKKDGKQVLQEMKEDPNLRRIPVVILSSSKAEQDVLQSYDLQASGYIIKPLDFEQFVDVVTAIEDFWFSKVALPSRV